MDQSTLRDPPAIGIIGCGAIARSFHLPALARHSAVLERVVLIDRDLDRAREAGAPHGITRTVSRHEDCLSEIDAAIVATPHHLHYPITHDCLRSGLHILCEKPLAESGAQVRSLVEAARAAGRSICVNNTRRAHPSAQKVRSLIQTGAIGEPRSIELNWGEQFAWPTMSGFYFQAGESRKGVLLDTGAHALDLICWWLGTKPDLTSYRDDAFGGAEAVAEVAFRSAGCTGIVRLSWLNRYENTFVIIGELGEIHGDLSDWRRLALVGPRGKRRTLRLSSGIETSMQFGAVVIDNFLQVIAGIEEPLVSGDDVLSSIDWIDECYTARRRFFMPWYDALTRIDHGH